MSGDVNGGGLGRSRWAGGKAAHTEHSEPAWAAAARLGAGKLGAASQPAGVPVTERGTSTAEVFGARMLLEATLQGDCAHPPQAPHEVPQAPQKAPPVAASGAAATAEGVEQE
mmetsp:Transcript_115834/g.236808  ORF Transcript_115834/g.236808 Transcript_115834/m.236808 type:complete len:113 (-) Transcript_115834:58-396(-)